MTGPPDFCCDIRDKSQEVGRAISKLAARQHGVVTHQQLLALGLTRHATHRRVESGRLHPLYRGVYAVGHTVVTPKGSLVAAVYACGEGAVLSHRSAAELWGFRRSFTAAVDVTVESSGRRKRRGIALHQVLRLHPGDCTRRERIPVTTVARTLLDNAAVLNRRQLDYLLEQAERQKRFDLTAIKTVLTRNPRHPGARPLRAAVSGFEEETLHTRSDSERDFLRFCRQHNLPTPAMNAVVAGHTVDAFWPEQRLVVEIDSAAYHRTPKERRRDAKRDADLQLAGHRVVRIPEEPLEEGVATVAAFLTRPP